MTLLGRLREPSPDLLAYVKKVEQRVRNLETNAQAGNTSVDSGTMIFNTDTETSFQVNIGGIRVFRITQNPDGSPDIRFWRTNGLTAFFLTEFANREIIGFQDGSLHTIMGDDAVTGWGLARPWLPVPFYDDASLAPTRTTTSASFVNLQYANYNVQHPFFTVTSLVRCSDGTTGGDITLAVNGEELPWMVTTIPIGSNTTFDMKVNFNDYGIDFGSYNELTVKARRTAGAGTIGVRVVKAYGHETPL